MVKWPIPGRTRFLSVEVDVAVAPITSSRADSSAACPVAAHSLWGFGIQACQIGELVMIMSTLCMRERTE